MYHFTVEILEENHGVTVITSRKTTTTRTSREARDQKWSKILLQFIQWMLCVLSMNVLFWTFDDIEYVCLIIISERHFWSPYKNSFVHCNAQNFGLMHHSATYKSKSRNLLLLQDQCDSVRLVRGEMTVYTIVVLRSVCP